MLLENNANCSKGDKKKMFDIVYNMLEKDR